jgi:hypothetical protein
LVATIGEPCVFAEGYNMHLLTWLLIVFGFGFAMCLLLLVNMIGDLSQVSVHESPAILEEPSKPASAEEPGAQANESRASRPTHLTAAP